MLPAFHGERMRRYESVIAEAATTEIDSWPLGEPFPIHPRMQAVTLEVILRAVFGVTDPARLERLRAMLALMLANMASPRLQIRALVAQRFGREDPIERLRQQTRTVDDLLLAEIAERRADPMLDQREDILSMLVRRGSRTASRWTTASFATSSSRCCSRVTRRPPRPSPGRSTCCCETRARWRGCGRRSTTAPATSTCAR